LTQMFSRFFLLVGFLLYNPFLTLIHSPNGFLLNHLPRHRATVGAGELQHFPPVTKNVVASVPVATCVGEIVQLLQEKEFPLATDSPSVPLTPSDYSSSLWVRPPPSA
jgi:hypothetical protein